MILFLYGEDNYRSSQKLKALKDKFVEKYGDTNLETFEEEFDLAKIKNSITALPFLSDKRMVVIKNILKSKSPTSPLQTGLRGASKSVLDDLVQILDHVPEETILIFWEEGVPDKRTALFKLLQKEKSEEFEKLQGYKLTKWIEEEISKRGGKISSRNAEKLASFVGNDLNQLENEIAKLVSFKDRKEIGSEDIDLLVKAKLSSNIFDLVDAVGERNYKKAAKFTHELLEQGENEIYILTMVVRQIRNLILISDLKDRFDKLQIAKETGIHPYAVQKTLLQTKNFGFEDLKRIYQELLDTDISIKTGEREPRLALDLLVKEICR